MGDKETGEDVPKMKDAPPDKDGNIPQVAKLDKDGNELMKDKKPIMVNKQVQEVRVEKRDRALRYPWISCKARPPKVADDDKQEAEKKDENAKPNEENTDEKMSEEDKKKADELKLDVTMKKLMEGTGGGGCKNFLHGLVPSTDRDFKCEWKKLSMKWIDFRKIIVYFVFIYLYNFLFNWAILLYMGHGYIDAIKIDFFSPSRKLTMYLKHVLNSIHTLVEFVNMLF